MRRGLRPAFPQARLRIGRARARLARHLRGEQFPSFRHSERSRGIPRYSRGHFHGILRLRGVYPERAKRVEWASLRMTMLEVTHLSFPRFASTSMLIATVWLIPDTDSAAGANIRLK